MTWTKDLLEASYDPTYVGSAPDEDWKMDLRVQLEDLSIEWTSIADTEVEVRLAVERGVEMCVSPEAYKVELRIDGRHVAFFDSAYDAVVALDSMYE